MLPNIVLIVADTLRADRLGSYGYTKNTTPHLDRLAQRGVRFSEAFSQANSTQPSFTTILSGLDPLNHGIVGHESAHGPVRPYTSLAERLAGIGYRTAAVDTLGRWLRRGFDRYVTYTYSHAVLPPGA